MMTSQIRPAPSGGLTIDMQALDAQAALLPYALLLFGVSLPIYVWAGSYAPNAVWMAASFAIFAINFGAFYAIINWAKGMAAQDLRVRARVQVLGALLWAGAVGQIAAFGAGAGPGQGAILALASAGAAVCMAFASPNLAALLIVGPAAAAGPLIAYFAMGTNEGLTAWGAFALTLALCLVFNRVLRQQFALAQEREALMSERAGSLVEAQTMARSKSDILATLSHEIRNGLTGVIHVLAAACGQMGRAPSREQMNAALEAARDLIAVLNATLDSETAQAGRLSLDNQPFDPVRLARDAVLLERPYALSKGLELTVHIEPELEADDRGAALADPMRTRQILANLLGNGIKYTLRGRVELRVVLRDGQVVFQVADTGPGLAAEELERAFEPFRRVERTGAGVSGAGLGLSLSRDLANLMGGSLEASSALGVGSCFTLALPYDAEVAAEPAAGFDPVASAGNDRTEPRRLRVLVAEDDALNAAMMRAILEQLGHQVVHAQNGIRAVELVKLCDFDLLMFDGRMPGLDGAGATAAVRALVEPTASTPIIAVIGGESDEAEACLDAGADAVLRKPVSVAAVARAVADAAASVRGPVQSPGPLRFVNTAG
jgi:signal transduction histidine kinase/CheY-like chemotaxis protein